MHTCFGLIIFEKTAGVVYMEKKKLLLNDYNCLVINVDAMFLLNKQQQLILHVMNEELNICHRTWPSHCQPGSACDWLAGLMLVQVDTCPGRAKPTLIVKTTYYRNATILAEATQQAAALMLLKLLDMVNLLLRIRFRCWLRLFLVKCVRTTIYKIKKISQTNPFALMQALTLSPHS